MNRNAQERKLSRETEQRKQNHEKLKNQCMCMCEYEQYHFQSSWLVESKGQRRGDGAEVAELGQFTEVM